MDIKKSTNDPASKKLSMSYNYTSLRPFPYVVCRRELQKIYTNFIAHCISMSRTYLPTSYGNMATTNLLYSVMFL